MRSGRGRARSSALVLAVFVAVLLAAGCTDDPSTTSPSIVPLVPGAPASATDASVIRYGLATSPANPWAHYRTSCDTACGIVFGAITDTLFATSVDNETVPLLVERASANNDRTVHTWRLRTGILFSDGSPFDAAAAKVNIDACRQSPLTGPGLAGIDDVRAEDQTLTITSLAPWASLPAHFAETPCGHMFSADWLETLADLPQRTGIGGVVDTAITATDPTGDAGIPIGLGPFSVVSFEEGNGNSLVVERNPTYWRGPSGITSETLPRLDTIEFVALSDEAVRLAGFDNEQLDIVHTSDARSRGILADADGAVVESAAYADTVHLVLNSAAPTDDDSEPLSLVSCRRALVRAVDRAAFALGVDAVPAGGPFGPGSLGHDQTAVAEPFDEATARRWTDSCLEATGVDDEPLRLHLLAGENDGRATALAAMINRAIGPTAIEGGDSASGGIASGGIEIEVIAVSGGELARRALLGDFEILLWENHGGTHPDLQFSWWYGEASAPVGSLSTNLGRIHDPALDRALVDLRRADDRSAVDGATARLGRAFTTNAWNVWLYWVEWMVAADPSVQLDVTRSTPDGIALIPMWNGVHSLSNVERP